MKSSGKVEASHWQDGRDTMAHIQDSVRSGEMLETEQVYTDLEATSEDVSFDEAMEQTRCEWQIERELLRNFSSDIMPGLK